MNKPWRRNFVLAILFASAGLAGAQVQDQTSTGDAALGPDYQQGKAALAAEKYEDALKGFKKANKMQNDACSACLVGMANAMARMGDTRGALNSAEKALAVAKTNEQRAEAHAMRGDILLGGNEEKKRSEAEAEYRAAVKESPESAEKHLKLAIALLKEVKDTEGKD
jgi:tetratricopeptide (TPR) repeat protein